MREQPGRQVPNGSAPRFDGEWPGIVDATFGRHCGRSRMTQQDGGQGGGHHLRNGLPVHRRGS